MRRISKLSAGIVAIVTALAAAAGCGGTPASAAEVVSRAPDKTLAASSARAKIDETISVGATSTHLTFGGAVDLRSGDGDFTINASQFGVTGASGPVEARFVHGVMYMNVAALARGDATARRELRGKEWLAIDMSKAIEAGKAAGTSPLGSTASLQYLRGTPKDGVDKIGTEEIDGASTTHYHTDISIAAIRSRVRAAQISADAKRAALSGLAHFSGATLPTDVWIDKAGRVRRVALSAKVAAAGRQASFRVRCDFADFGTPLHVIAPPASKVTTLSQITSQSGTAST